ncbi:MAG: ABC transporter permease [Alistipes sp.]|nr:ABC transporter permease [Alistipes sp.]
MKIAFKNFLMTLRRYKVASLLNVLGLTLAFVAFYIIASQVWYSVTYNSSLKDAERTYLLMPRWDVNRETGVEQWFTNSPQPASYEALELCPEAEIGASFIPHANIDRVWTKESDYDFEKFPIGVYFGNAPIVELFGFECVAGDLKKIVEPNTVIVARSAAEQMGVGVGDEIWFEGGDWNNDGKPTHPQTIVAVYEDFARNTFLHRCRIIQNDNLKYGEGNNNWNYSFFVRLKAGADPEKFARIWSQQYDSWFEGMMKEWAAEEPEQAAEIMEGLEQERHQPVKLVALDDLYYEVQEDSMAIYEGGSRSATVVLIAIAFVIVAIAFINFVNFFLALVPVRLRTVNICKVYGASQRTLRWNFLFEAIGLVLISMALALYLMIAIQESFITEYVTCSLELSANMPVIAMMLGFMVLLALAAALYPAFYITRFNASLGVKGGFAQSATGRRLRSVMVGVQFSVAIVLIIVTAVFFLQYRYMAKFDMGFDRENIVTFYSGEIGGQDETLIDRLMQHPDVVDATASRFNIFQNGQQWGREYEGVSYQLRPNAVRWNFVDFFGFELVEGVNFTPTSAERNEMIIMRSFNREVGVPVGYHFEDNLDVVGVIKDVRLSSAGLPDAEYYSFFCSDDFGTNYNYYVKLGANSDVEAFAKYVRDLCKELNPNGDDVELYYLDDFVESMYKETRRQTIIIGMFAILAIVIALMGVFGIVLFETQHRRSEIAVRKVYGATTRQIVKMLNLRYVWIVGGCFVVAAPVAWYITSRWLEQFANRITQPWWLYIAALVVVLAVTVGLVTLRSWRAATENPADVVKGN